MSNLKSRIRRIETGLDVGRLSREQVQLLDVSKLTREQRAALDGSHLTDEQIDLIGLDKLTDAQLAAVSKGFDERYPEMAAVIHVMSDEELTAVKERRLDVWYPGFNGEWSE
jgi:hypothetical protein